MDNLSNLVKIYLFVCDEYEKTLKFTCQRFTNNNKPIFADQEIMTVMLYCTGVERRFRFKEVYDFTSNYLRPWFPLLPSYPAFIKRVNRMSETFRLLFASILENNAPQNRSQNMFMVDSMPIVICSGKRSSKVAKELTDKSFCASKSMFYYGVKLHFLTSRVKGTLPFPEGLIVTPASEADLNVFRDNWSNLPEQSVFADKAYQDNAMETNMLNLGSEILSPVKYPKGVPEAVKQFFRAADDLYSHAVSSVRQPIESLFSWLIEKSDIQRASKVRSTNGLFVHIFSKLAAVFLQKLVFNGLFALYINDVIMYMPGTTLYYDDRTQIGGNGGLGGGGTPSTPSTSDTMGPLGDGYPWAGLSEAEKKFVIANPLIAKAFYDNSKKAKAAVVGIEGEGNGRGDAIRHAYWSALNSKAHGEKYAREYGNAHEEGSDDPAATEMDLYNNNIGYKIGNDAKKNGWTDVQILDTVKKSDLQNSPNR